MSATKLLEKAAGHLKDRAATYDKPEGERSIGAAVRAFNAVTGDGLMNTGERGWLFMAILKMVRSQQGNYRADNYEDLAAYSALMGEAACEERNGGWTDKEIKAAAFRNQIKKTCESPKPWPDGAEVEWPDESRIDVIGQNGNDGAVYSDCTLQEVIGDAELSDWARWVAVDKDGEVYEFSGRPYLDSGRVGVWNISMGDKCDSVKDIDPPADYTKCIWKIKK